MDGCRPEVIAFALLMEQKLKENDNLKTGWKSAPYERLLTLMDAEVSELKTAVRRCVRPVWSTEKPSYVGNWGVLYREREDGTPEWASAIHHVFQPEAEYHELHWIGREAADVANFAMMVADVCGALPLPSSPRA